MPGGTLLAGRPGTATSYVRERLEQVVGWFRLPRSTVRRPIRLPDLPPAPGARQTPRGVRLFIQLTDHEQSAYRVPIVAPVPLSVAHWEALSLRGTGSVVPVAALLPWLEQVYPVGMKEMVGAAVRNDTATGELTLRSAGSDARFRYGIVTGELALTLAGRSRVRHGGSLTVLIAYPQQGSGIVGLKGVFEGVYPETDPQQQRTTPRRYRAVIESLA